MIIGFDEPRELTSLLLFNIFKIRFAIIKINKTFVNHKRAGFLLACHFLKGETFWSQRFGFVLFMQCPYANRAARWKPIISLLSVLQITSACCSVEFFCSNKFYPFVLSSEPEEMRFSRRSALSVRDEAGQSLSLSGWLTSSRQEEQQPQQPQQPPAAGRASAASCWTRRFSPSMDPPLQRGWKPRRCGPGQTRHFDL